jgi:hypothetical protein
MENEKKEPKYTIAQLRKALEKKEYKFFDSKDEKAYNLNIIGVRHSNHMTNKFVDLLYLIFSDPGSEKLTIFEFPITTVPGYAKPKTKKHPDGTAILVPGQYLGVYSIAKHKNKYAALCQIGEVKVWRDKDGSHDINPKGQIYDNAKGINIHRATANGSSHNVNNWSKGCQVFQNSDDFKFFMNCCDHARKNFGNRFTYTLIMEADIPKS